MRQRSSVGSSKSALSRQLSSIAENALRPKHAYRDWKRPLAVKKLADELGVSYQSLAYYLSARNNIPAFVVPGICKALNDYALLDVLEKKARRVAYHLPVFSGNLAQDDLRAVQKLVKEVAQALESLSDTLKDGRVEEHEFEHTSTQLHHVIRECVRLEHWLQQRSEGKLKPVA
jgi:hypothetical protein